MLKIQWCVISAIRHEGKWSCDFDKLKSSIYIYNILVYLNLIGGVMVSVLTSNAVDCGFKPWSSQTKDKKIGICEFPLTTQQ